MRGRGVLVVGPGPEVLTGVESVLEADGGLRCQWASYETAKQELQRDPQRTVFLDMRPGANWDALGDLLQHCEFLEDRPGRLVAMIDGGFPRELALLVDALVTGTLAFPLDGARVSEVMRRLDRNMMVARTPQPTQPRTLLGKTQRFVTYHEDLFAMLDDLELAAHHDVTLLLIGETGTGKTYLAHLLHELSPRAEDRFLTVPCGALPPDLIESELFGHMKGAFTGAERNKIGKFEAAESGTLLLDEIDVLGPEQQAKLLRVIETGEFEPVGSNETHISHARAIVASNVDLEILMENERFRPDLYYRLNELKFFIPPLRKRPNDIVPLALNFVESFCEKHDLKIHSVHPDFLEVLRTYHWPGNIRELKNQMGRAVLFCRTGELTTKDLSATVLQAQKTVQARREAPMAASNLTAQVATTEQEIVEQTLRAHDFNRAATARALGISRVTLYNKMRKYGMIGAAGENTVRGSATPIRESGNLARPR
ncbi:MAG: sigma-54-dependent Fis family transcriptional regulator [Pirellulales bacterium]|nr:sigma-54-dependent Fis family transcriptional regulator [Pirellulales bacterium]